MSRGSKGAYARNFFPNEQSLREAVARQWRAGLSDWAIAKRLQVKLTRVQQVRAALGLKPNKGGEYL